MATEDERKQVSEILMRMRNEEGRSRQWLAEKADVSPLEISRATTNSRSKEGWYLCSDRAVEKIITWIQEPK